MRGQEVDFNYPAYRTTSNASQGLRTFVKRSENKEYHEKGKFFKNEQHFRSYQEEGYDAVS
jgi:hypothetical protein